ncbi:hypothetical protein ACH5RR_021587 [Cinchona calisaya]|uniref:Uncharacterized protein n=1 Tax=Cinchona calisaya TaxID=153742 RepID=A0ABD2ZHZ4_9GENT
MHKQEPINNIPIRPIENPRIDRREEDTGSNTQRVSNHRPQVIRTVSRQKSRSLHDRYPRPNMEHREETLKLPLLTLEEDIIAKFELQIQQLFS